MAENNKISAKARLDWAIDLKCRGLTDKEISDRMREEGYRWVSERTINKILNEVPEERVVEELKRLQLRTITTADVALQLKYRDKILEKLMPKRIEQQIGGATDVRIVIEDGNPQMETPPRTEGDLAE